MATRRELAQAIGERYRSASRIEKRRILDEFVAVADFKTLVLYPFEKSAFPDQNFMAVGRMERCNKD